MMGGGGGVSLCNARPSLVIIGGFLDTKLVYIISLSHGVSQGAHKMIHLPGVTWCICKY